MMFSVKNKQVFYILLLLFFTGCNKEDDMHTVTPLQISYSVNNVSLYGGNDGFIDITVTGGSPPYTYLWSNGAVSEDINCLPAGTYSIIITDAAADICTDTIEITEPVPDTLVIEFSVINPSRDGVTDGSIDITINGGHPPYTFLWSTGSTREDIHQLGFGEYTVTVEDHSGQQKELTIVLSNEKVQDIDGNVYTIIQIGEQTWMKENLKVMHTPDNTPIVSYCYNDDPINAEKYGRLYTWDVAMNGSTVEMARGICPEGWHVPSDEEWQTLEIYLGMTPEEAVMENTWRGTDVGTKLKEGGESGYDALLSGRRSSIGSYMLLDQFEYIWTSTEYGEYAWRRCLDVNSNTIGRWNTFPKTYAFSVRCIKDED